MILEAVSFGEVAILVDPKGGEAKWLWKAAWTELNFCRLFIWLIHHLIDDVLDEAGYLVITRPMAPQASSFFSLERGLSC